MLENTVQRSMLIWLQANETILNLWYLDEEEVPLDKIAVMGVKKGPYRSLISATESLF
jgi:hypothetical protein